MERFTAIPAANAALDGLAIGETVDLMGEIHRVVDVGLGKAYRRVRYTEPPETKRVPGASRWSRGLKRRSVRTWVRIE